VDLEDDGLTTPNLFGIQVQKKNSLDLGKLINDAYNASLVGQTEASLNLYQQALQAEPNNQNILYAIGTLYHNLHQLDQAKVYYKKILSLDPNHSKAMSNFISVIAEEAPERALGQLQELARQNPNFSPVQAQIGMIYAKQNDLVTAEQYLRRASALSPEVMMYRYNLAVLYERMHLKEEAVRIYKQVLEASYQGYNIPVGANVIKERIYALTDASGR
jgi:tetratricopeptide (TPR) repeat protein